MDPFKEYLVKLGFKVNNAQYAEFKKFLQSASTDVNTFEQVSVSSMAAASVAIFAFMATANKAIASFIGNLAKADIETELFARRMWVTVEQGRAIQTALKTMNADIEDIWFSPTLRNQFMEIQKTIQEVEVPEDYREKMQDVRDIQLEFMKLKVILAYAAQWIGYYIIKYAAGPMAEFKGDIKDINEYLKNNLPEITEKVGQFLSNFLRIGSTVFNIFKGITKTIVDLPDEVKTALIAITGIMAVFSANPFMLAIMGLSMLLLLLEDYYTYKRGGQSAFEELWKEIDRSDKFSELKDTFDKLKESIESLGDNVDDLFNSLSRLFGLDGGGFVDGLSGIADFIAERLNNELEGLIFLLDTLNAMITPDENMPLSNFGPAGSIGDMINGTSQSTTTDNSRNIIINNNFDNSYDISGNDSASIARNIGMEQFRQLIKTRNFRNVYE